MSRAPIQLDYAIFQPDPARRSRRAAAAVACCVVFLTLGALAFTTAAVLLATRPWRSWGDVLFLAIYGATFGMLAVLWSLGRAWVSLMWNLLVLAIAMLLSLIAFTH